MRHFLYLVLCVLILVPLSGCGGKEPIKIGLAVELTGKQADVGINVRDAAQMAVDEINTSGGVNGRPLELLIRDDEGKPDVARRVDAELVELGVVAIIGHYTSGQTEAVLEQMNQARVVLISPSASSSEFSGKDDYFFRLISDTKFIGQRLAIHIDEDHDIERLVVLYDKSNRAFSESFWHALDEQFRALGGETELITFSANETNLQKVAAEVVQKQPQGIVLIASAVDTAVLAQYIRQAGGNIPLFSSPWAQTEQLIDKGGQTVNGLEIGAFYSPTNQNSAHIAFSKKFEERFKRETQLGTSQAYEIVMVLAECLKMTNSSAEGLREALYQIQDFPGILGPISFDQFGDVQRDIYIIRIENGQFIEKTVIFAE
jgi:branched-chain amino acid transport system substrate-binding protein